MNRVEVHTQAELDAVLAKNDLPICSGGGYFVLRDSSHAELWDSSHAELLDSSHAELWDSSHAELWGSSHAELRDSSHAELRDSSHAVLRDSSHAELWGSSHAELRGSSHAVLRGSSHAELRGSSHAVLWDSSHAELRDSSHAELRDSSHAELWGSSHAVLWDSSHAEGHGPYPAIHVLSSAASAVGGIIIPVAAPTSPAEWCDYYGIAVLSGIAVLYKAVCDDYLSAHGVSYRPGASPPVAADWDGGTAECGGGLHFSPHPAMAGGFDSSATRYVACPVALSEMRPPRETDEYPNKIKARRVCGPIVEVDRLGRAIVLDAQAR